MFLAIERTKAVLPIAGRAAMMIRSESCQPEVILSRPSKPVRRPLKPSFWLAAFCNISIASLMMGLICVTSFLTFRCEISNSLPSASCIRSSTSIVSSNALSCIWAVNEISSRARYFWAMIRA